MNADRHAASGCRRAPRLLGVLGLCLPFFGLQAAPARPGAIQFSDGSVVSGRLSLAAGRMLKLHDGQRLREIPFADVCEIRFFPESEKMERRWRFVEAGRTEKEFRDEPYPVRHLSASLYEADQGATGHLYTTAVTVETPDETRRVVIRAKLRGEEGQTFENLPYPVRISFDDAPPPTAGLMNLSIRRADGRPVAAVCAIVGDSLGRFPATPDGDGRFPAPNPRGAPLFLAADSGGVLDVGWPESRSDELMRVVSNALNGVRDFFDDRRLLAVYRRDAASDVYSLVLLRREGRTSLQGARSQPWRLGLWRWKVEAGMEPMLAGRSYFFRGLAAAGEAPPKTFLDSDLWLEAPSERTGLVIGNHE